MLALRVYVQLICELRSEYNTAETLRNIDVVWSRSRQSIRLPPYYSSVTQRVA